MQSLSTVSPIRRCGRLLFLPLILLPVIVIWSLWYAMNSDNDDVPPFLTQIIPAGHATCQTSTVFECSSCLEPSSPVYVNETDVSNWTFQWPRDSHNVGLRDDQCEQSFPGLFEDIRRAYTSWGITGRIPATLLDGIELQNGMTRAMIYNRRLYVIATKSKAEDHRRKTLAVLSSMNRALAAAQDSASIPDIDFVFSIEDMASDVTSENKLPLWVLARKASEKYYFLLPDFGFWAWDNIIKGQNNEIGPYDEVVENALDREHSLSFSDKEPQLVWRGKLSFAPKLRRAFLDASRGASWNNVKELNWDVRENYLTLEDHCRYQFIAHVEGRSYSASLKYRQACRSVIIIHKLQYIQHHHYLLVSSGPQQNYVEVERDFSDLAEKMDDLLNDSTKAALIADNSVRTFRERYLTPAAEACYWRALWRGYAMVTEPSQLWETVGGERRKRGLRYETFVLLSSDEMLDFKAS